MSTVKLFDQKQSAELQAQYRLLIDGQSVEPHEKYSMTEADKAECLRNCKLCSTIVGFCIGVFIQFSSLALNFFVGNDKEDEEPCPLAKYAIFSCLWSMSASVMGVAVLLFLRSMVITAFYSSNSFSNHEDAQKLLKKKEDFMVMLVQNLERYFSIGTVFGVGTAWAFTDLALGIKPPLVQYICVVLVTCVWYCVTSNSKKQGQV